MHHLRHFPALVALWFFGFSPVSVVSAFQPRRQTRNGERRLRANAEKRRAANIASANLKAICDKTNPILRSLAESMRGINAELGENMFVQNWARLDEARSDAEIGLEQLLFVAKGTEDEFCSLLVSTTYSCGNCSHERVQYLSSALCHRVLIEDLVLHSHVIGIGCFGRSATSTFSVRS